MDWTPTKAYKVGDRISFVGPPPLTWLDRILWRLFRIERKRQQVRQEAVVTQIASSDCDPLR